MKKEFTRSKVRKTWAINPKTRVKPARGEKIYKRSETRKIEREWDK